MAPDPDPNTDTDPNTGANPYTEIIATEARSRGIAVEMLDPDTGEMILRHGGHSVRTIQSLSEMTSALTYLDCDDKVRSRRLLGDAGLPIPPGRRWSDSEADRDFVRVHGPVVVKPARGEGGQGISVGVTLDDLDCAVATARAVCDAVLVEARCPGDDLRILVIDGEVVAAAVRRPPLVVGDGRSTVRELNVRRSTPVPTDEVTIDHLRREGLDLDDVVEDQRAVTLRGTANVHTGGTIDDVTDVLHPALAATALRAAAVVDAPVLGVDLLVPDVGSEDHVVIEINEQPGLANHEPQPTAARFVDLLFPETAAQERSATGRSPSRSA